jgi:hypothetical protein
MAAFFFNEPPAVSEVPEQLPILTAIIKLLARHLVANRLGIPGVRWGPTGTELP